MPPKLRLSDDGRIALFSVARPLASPVAPRELNFRDIAES
jgi:hypothetical protein